MIRGHFGLGRYDHRALQDGNGLIRGGFKRTLGWSEKILSAIGSDQRPFRAEIFSSDFLFYSPRDVGSAKGNRKQHSDHRHI